MWPLPQIVNIIDYPKPAVFYSCEVFHLLARIHHREPLSPWTKEWLEFWDQFAVPFPQRCPYCHKDEKAWKDPPPPPHVYLKKGDGILASDGLHPALFKSRFSILFPYSSRQALKMIGYLDAGTIAHKRKSYRRRKPDFPVRQPHGGLLASDGQHPPFIHSRFSKLFPYTSRKAIAMVNWADPGPPPRHPIKMWREGKVVWEDPPEIRPPKPLPPPPERPRKKLKAGGGLTSSAGKRPPVLNSRFSTLFPYTSRKALQMLPWADPGPLPIHPIKTFPKRVPEPAPEPEPEARSQAEPPSAVPVKPADGKQKTGKKVGQDVSPPPPPPPPPELPKDGKKQAKSRQEQAAVVPPQAGAKKGQISPPSQPPQTPPVEDKKLNKNKKK